MSLKRLFPLTVLMVLPMFARANDFPTLDRVDYVLTCMKKHGGQTLDNMYSCACEIDALAEKIGYDDYVEAATYASYKNMPGEKGSIFRDSPRGDELTAKLKTLQTDAEKRCFIKTKTVTPQAAEPKK
jgi:hypothetical protein